MQASILIHDPVILALQLSLVLSSCGAPALSAYAGAMLHACGKNLQPSIVYAITLAFLGCGQIVVFGPDLLTSPLTRGAPMLANSIATACALILAPAIAYLSYSADLAIGRRIYRRRKPFADAPPQMAALIASSSPWERGADGAKAASRVPRSVPPANKQPPRHSTALLCGIGAGEELAIRAVIITVCTVSFLPVAVVALLAALWFSAIHVRFGAGQIWQKLPLSIGASLLFLAGGIIPAAVAHALFNYAVARRLRTLVDRP